MLPVGHVLSSTPLQLVVDNLEFSFGVVKLGEDAE